MGTNTRVYKFIGLKPKKKIILLKQQLQKQQLNFKILYKKLKLKQKTANGKNSLKY